MKLNKKSRDKIFDLHLGLTFDWRETGLLRWRIFLWMLFLAFALLPPAFLSMWRCRKSAAGEISRVPWWCCLQIIRACISMCCAILLCL